MIKDSKPYHILVMEDNEGDYTIVEDFLSEQILVPVIRHAKTFSEGSKMLGSTEKPFDVILLDLRLPDKDGQELITEMLRLAKACPIIVLTGYSDISFSIKSISDGILDYLLKDEMSATTLYKSILYSIERKKNISEIRASQKQYSDLFQLSPQPMCLYEMNTFRFLEVNKAAMEHYGYSREEFMEMTLLDLVSPEDKQNSIDIITGQKRVLNQTYAGKARNHKKNGEIIEVETYSTPILINENPTTLVIAIDVTQKNQYERNILKAIIKTQEDERYEIGAELHDNVCQILAVSKMTLEMIEKSLSPVVKAKFNQCREYIGLALKEIRNLSHRLAPAFLDDSTLEEAFVRLFATFDADKKNDYILNFDIAVITYWISPEIQLNLYRILQEQLRNIFKYAKAEKIEVYVSVSNNVLQMRISDNGIGFNIDTSRTGIGISNMKRRAELFSGTCQIISSPGKGCHVTISIPLPSAARVVESDTLSFISAY